MALLVTERRRSQRFDLSLPVRILRLGGQQVDMGGETQNVSSAGALFAVDGETPRMGSSIEFLLTLNSARAGSDKPTVRLRCRGRITRAVKGMREDSENIAATIDRYRFIRE